MIGSFTSIQNDRTQFKKETLPKSHIHSHVNSILFPSIDFLHGRFNIVGFEPTFMGKNLNPTSYNSNQVYFDDDKMHPLYKILLHK